MSVGAKRAGTDDLGGASYKKTVTGSAAALEEALLPGSAPEHT